MAIKNYRTSVNAIKTVGEINAILVSTGASNVSVDYVDKKPDGIKFSLDVYKQTFTFRLPCNPHGVLATMKRDGVGKSLCTLEHARNVSWRIIKDWLHAQIAIIDAGQAKAAEVFFPYLLESSGETIYQKFENQQLQLTS